MPELVGSRKPRHALAATAASIAEPPFFRVSMAVSVASGCAVPAAPERPIAAERLAKLAPEGRSPACTSGRMNLSSPSGWNLGRGWSCDSADFPCGFESGAVTEADAEPLLASDAVAAAATGIVAMKERRRMGPPQISR